MAVRKNTRTQSASKQAKRAPAQKNTDAELRLYQKLRRAPAAFSREDMHAMETAYQKHAFGPEGFAPYRRSILFFLSMPAKKVFDGIRDDREEAVAFADALLGARAYVEWLRAVTETMVAGITRLEIALCAREDMDEVIAEAEKTEKRVSAPA
jgi:hypothetical protein